MMPPAQTRPLFLLAALFAPLGVIAPKALVPLLFIAALWQLARRWRDGQPWRPFRGASAVMAGLIAAWALLSGLWALDGAAALVTFTKLAGVLIALLVMLDGVRDLDAAETGPLSRALLWSFVLAALVLGFETLSDMAGHKWLVWGGRRQDFELTVLNRAEIVLLLAVWPVALVLWRRGRRPLALVAVLAAAAIAMLGVSSSNQVAVMVALTGAVLAWFPGPRLQRVLALLVAIGVLVAPVLPSSVLAPQRLAGHFDDQQYSALHRLHIWHFTGRRIAEAPILGWGLDAARRIPGGDAKLPGGGSVMSMHPHNAGLQIWLELGAVGALLTAMLLAGLWLRAAALIGRAERAAATGLILSGLVVANLSFGIWQTWWMAALATSGVLFTLTVKSTRK